MSACTSCGINSSINNLSAHTRNFLFVVTCRLPCAQECYERNQNTVKSGAASSMLMSLSLRVPRCELLAFHHDERM